jgi:hypothetical protein
MGKLYFALEAPEGPASGSGTPSHKVCCIFWYWSRLNLRQEPTVWLPRRQESVDLLDGVPIDPEPGVVVSLSSVAHVKER